MATVIRRARLDHDPLLLALRRQQQGTEAARAQAAPEPLPEPPELDHEALQDAASDFEAEREALLRAGYDSGYEQGFKQGEQDVAARQEEQLKGIRERLHGEHTTRIKALDALLRSLQERLEQVPQETQDALVEIAFEALCKILGDKLSERAAVIACVQSALTRAPARERLTLRVAPRDLQLLEDNRPQLLSMSDSSHLELVADARVSLGGCIIESAGGTLDARIETQLQSLREVLVNARGAEE